MSDYDRGHQYGMQGGALQPSFNAAEEAGWRQAKLQQEREAQRLREAMAYKPGYIYKGNDYKSSQNSGPVNFGENTGGSARWTLAGLLIIVLLPFIIFSLVATFALAVVVALAAGVVSPFVGTVGRLAGGEPVSGFIEAYKLMFKSLAAYAVTFFGLGLVLGLLGDVFPHVAPIAAFSHVANALWDIDYSAATPFGRVPLTETIGTAAVLQVPALAAFSWMVRRSSLLLATGKGFLQGMAFGAAAVIAGGAGVLAALYLIEKYFGVI